MPQTLRQQCKERFKVAFDSVRVVSGSMTFILVVDEKALKILSNTIKMMELINYGITSIEKLQLKRKKFKKIEAVYLIHHQSYGLLLDDYQQGEEAQYHSIHVLSLGKIPPYVMSELGKNQKFLKRCKTLKELNLNFDLYSHNQVKLLTNSIGNFGAPLLTQSAQNYQTCISNTIDQLSTVLTSMSSFYIVEIFYNKSDLNNFSEKVALGLKEKLEHSFKLFERDGVANFNSGAPQTTFLILDRTVDPVSPLVRDYHYGPLLYDFKDIKNHKCTVTKNNQKKIFHLDQNDQIMLKYQNQHFATTLTGLQKDFQNFTQSHAVAKLEKNKEQQMSMDKMAEVISTMPKYNEFKDRYGFHIEMLSDMYQFYQKQKLKQQGQLQQTIISGVGQNGKKVKGPQFLEQVLAFSKKTKPQQRAKLLLLCLMCLDLKTKERNTIAEHLGECEKYINCQNSFQHLLGSSIIQLNSKKDKNNLILDRHLSKVQEIVRDIANGGQGGMKLIRVGGGNTVSKAISKASSAMQSNLGRKKIGTDAKENLVAKPRLIIFMGSAIGYNQIRAISELESQYHIIFVSHNFATQNQYLGLMSNMVQDDQL